jgi:predicted transcriptional regulator YheO
MGKLINITQNIVAELQRGIFVSMSAILKVVEYLECDTSEMYEFIRED